MMSHEGPGFAWSLIVDLRKELIETQRIRSQVIGFKITFVSTSIGIIAAIIDKVPFQLFIIPAFAAIFFDLLINSYGFSIKRIGFYCRTYVEPALKKTVVDNKDWPTDMPLWEEFLDRGQFRQALGLWGNLGITGLAAIVAVIASVIHFDWRFDTPALILLAIFFGYDVISFWRTDRLFLTLMSEQQSDNGKIDHLH